MNAQRFDRRSPLRSVLCALLIATLPALAGAAAAPPTANAPGAPAAGGTNASGATSGGAAGAPQQPGTKADAAAAVCDLTGFSVSDAYREIPPPAPKGPGTPDAKGAAPAKSLDIQLQDVLTVEAPGLMEKFDATSACQSKKLVLYLDGRPIPDLVAYPPTDPKDPKGIIRFTLKPTSASRDAWVYLLGSPSWDPRPTAVSVGLADGFPLPNPKAPYLRLKAIPHERFAVWALLFAVLLVAFFILAAKSEVLRDVGPLPGGGARRPFSLSRTQAAWWFFIILGSYLLIGIVTGDYLNSITGSVLVLLGISAGTVVGAAAIDAGTQTPENKIRQANAMVQLSGQVTQAGANAQAAVAAHADQADEVKAAAEKVADARLAQPTNPDHPSVVDAEAAHAVETARAAQLQAVLTAAQADLEEKKSQLRAARNQSENFFIDILSDADGVSFHRFQNAAWSIVLGIIFGCAVYSDLAMPQFNGTLLALMGISAGTYLGMKIPEPKVPTVTP